jgi:hypothetical protein
MFDIVPLLWSFPDLRLKVGTSSAEVFGCLRLRACGAPAFRRDAEMENAPDYTRKAHQCRRLAWSINVPEDPAIGALLALAAKYDAKAALYRAVPEGDRAAEA